MCQRYLFPVIILHFTKSNLFSVGSVDNLAFFFFNLVEMMGNEGLQALPTVQLQHISVVESAEPRRDQVRGFLYKFTVTNWLSMETYFHRDKE